MFSEACYAGIDLKSHGPKYFQHKMKPSTRFLLCELSHLQPAHGSTDRLTSHWLQSYSMLDAIYGQSAVLDGIPNIKERTDDLIL